jgi:tRNA splicing endonuclease
MGFGVCIESKPEADLVYRCGFFGKGTLSRSKPQYRAPPLWQLQQQLEQQQQFEQYARYCIDADSMYPASAQYNPNNSDNIEAYQPLPTPSEPTATDHTTTTTTTNTTSSGDTSATDHEARDGSQYEPYIPEHEPYIPDVATTTTTAMQPIRRRFHVKTMRQTPYDRPVTQQYVDAVANHAEVLQLLLEEAFYLLQVGGCLSIYRDTLTTQPMTIDQCWKAFLSVKPMFAASYAVYHHYRKRYVLHHQVSVDASSPHSLTHSLTLCSGWVPKSGLKYGCHLLLYRNGPTASHAAYGASCRVFGIELQQHSNAVW